MILICCRLESLVGRFMKQQMKGEWAVVATEESINRKRERRQQQIGSEIHNLINQAFIDQRLGLPLTSMKYLTRPIWDLTSVKLSNCLSSATVGYILHLDAGIAKVHTSY